MVATFDGASKRIILDSTSVTASELWSAYVDWLDDDSDNHKWGAALSQTGGDDLGGGLYIPVYIFLLNGWRVRPMESNHTLTLTGNLFVEGGGDNPVVSTLGTYRVLTVLTVPVQAQAYDAGGGSAPTAAQVASAVRTELDAELDVLNTFTFTSTNVNANVKAVDDSTTAAAQLRKSLLTTRAGTVQSGSTATSIITDLTESTDDIFKNRLVTFYSGGAAVATGDITAYNGTTKRLTVSGLPVTPSAGDLFIVL